MLFAVALASLCLPAACATAPYKWAKDIAIAQPSGEPVIGPRDTLLVHAGSQKDIAGEFVVREDGQYLQPPVGNIVAVGQTPSQLARTLSAKLQGIVINPQVSVSLPKRAPIRVYVIGEVKAAASYELDRDRSVTAALAMAGWLNEYASPDGIFVVRPKSDPARIRFRSQDLKRGEPHSALFQLQDGDVIVVE